MIHTLRSAEKVRANSAVDDRNMVTELMGFSAASMETLLDMIIARFYGYSKYPSGGCRISRSHPHEMRGKVLTLGHTVVELKLYKGRKRFKY